MSSILEIAKRAGVSHMTVSNILNGRTTPVRTAAIERADRIRQIAKQVGYRPNLSARAMRSGRTGYYGMIRSPIMSRSVHDPLFDAGIDEALHAKKLCLLRDIIDEPENGNEPGAPRIVRDNAVDGLIINYAFGTPEPVRELLDRCHIPAVWINRKRDENCVHPNDRGAAIEATRHLIALGHTRIEYIRTSHQNAERESHYSRSDRFAGYEHAMRKAGLTPSLRPITSLRFTRKRVGHYLNEYQARLAEFKNQPAHERPTAILCENHGRVLIHAAASLNLRVPEDLSVLTFDGDAPADETVAVDRVLVRYKAMGIAAVEELTALIDAPDTPRAPVMIPFEFHSVGTVSRLDSSN